MPGGVAPTTSYTTAQAAVQITRDNDYWGSTLGQPANVTYGFRDSIPTGYVSTTEHKEGDSFQALTLDQQLSVSVALRLWSDIAGITFTRKTDPGSTLTNNASILFGTYDPDFDDGSAAFAQFPGSTAATSVDGDVWLNRESFGTTAPDIGSRNFMALMHEIGHAIGLQHPGDYNAAPGVSITYENDALYIQDTNQYTMMSYFEFQDQPEAPLLHDIAAAQRLYGANLTTRLENTTYGFDSTITGPTRSIYDFDLNTAPNFAIWDAGGIDTINASRFFTSQVIDLRPNSFSSIGNQTNNIAMAAEVRNSFGVVVNYIENAIGGDGHDSMIGNAADNILIGGEGWDTLQGGDGNDQLFSGNGDDFLQGGEGDDSLYGGEGDDVYQGGNGFDLVSFAGRSSGVAVDLVGGPFSAVTDPIPMSSIEDIRGTDYADVMYGRAGEANYFSGGGGNDTLAGRGGADVLKGELGDDQILVRGGELSVDGGFGGFDSLVVDGTAGSFDWTVNSFSVDGAGIFQVLDFEIARGGMGNDRFVATFINLSFYGGAGNDTLWGGAGDNVIEGGAGADELYFGGGYDYADYRSDTTGVLVDIRSFIAADGDATGDLWLDAPEGILAGAGNDSLGGSEGDNRILGRAGNDYISGYGGLDTLDGGEGDDSIEGGLGADTVFAGDGNDVVGDAEQIVLFLATSDNDDDVLSGGAGNDTLLASGGNDSLDGATEDDSLAGGEGADSLTGGNGNDTLADHTQRVDGGGALLAGAYTATDADGLVGGAGVDFIIASGGGDVIDGGLDIDSLLMDFSAQALALAFTFSATKAWAMTLGGVTTATITGVETILINGGTAADVMNASGAAFYAVLDGAGGNDQLRGGASGDILSGGSGKDRLFGNGSDDLLFGGAGKDILAGGAGGDTFRWDTAAEAKDTIQDFASGLDRFQIDASGFKGGLKAGMDLAATGRFVLGTAATEAKGQFLYDQGAGVLSWDVDGTGAKAATLLADLGAGTAVAASDFLLVA